ncbi:MAG TPA: circularly permuted type 2 ATP-grasp protein [Bryobacteraceae bacterium]|nr:circularly permuted type 2 ATP-grasp protein [Bryobacteraceae bacterium]
MPFAQYQTDGFYDEMFDPQGAARAEARLLLETVESLDEGQLQRCQRAAERLLLQLGVTFNVYGDSAGTERIFPFDLIPRIVHAGEWSWIERGLKQRIRALNEFIDDIYHDQKILKDKVIPEEVIRSAIFYRPQCVGINPPRRVWCHITGTDLVRHGDGQVYVLEDNLRVPSGVSYVLENRDLMKRTFPQIFEGLHVRPVDDYPSKLLETLEAIAPPSSWQKSQKPTVVLLTPGMYNSAYFEHSFLAQKMGIQLVEGRDLAVLDGAVWMRTTKGLRKVDVIYRRIDDDFLDPQAFRPDSLLGVPGLVEAYRAGNVALANAPGNGVADDKVVYAYVPDMIRYYEGEDPILPNVPTFLCWRDQDRQHVLQNLDKLVVKSANEAGGYGMLVGPHSTAGEREEFAGRIQARPRDYIAQPTLALSRVPTLVEDHLEGRHVDLRPYILYGQEIQVLPGGLTRVALRKGSLVVNSSQGGGSKDTWVLADDGPHDASFGSQSQMQSGRPAGAR